MSGPHSIGLIGRMEQSSCTLCQHARAPRKRIDEAAQDAGWSGDPVALHVNVRITTGASEGWLVGGQDHWLEQLRWLHDEQRIDAFIFWPDGADVDRQLRAYAELAGELRR